MRTLERIAFGGTLVMAVLGSPSAAQKAQLYQFDPAHAVLEFGVRLAGFNRVRGSFDEYDGWMLVVDDDPLRSNVALTIDVASVHTGVRERDNDLKAGAFFDAAKWPRITFASKRVERDGAGFVAIGALTIRDVTREVRVPFSIVVTRGIDPFGNTRFAAAGKLVLNRNDFGVTGPAFWNRAISDSVEIEFEMPGRRWDYTKLDWGGQRRASAGQVLFDSLTARPLDAAISGGWALYSAHRSDTTYNFSSFEYEKAAGRLAQQGKLKEATAALELGIRIARDRNKPEQRAALEVLLAEELLRSGDRAKALEHARAAVDADPTQPGAQLLVAFLKP